MIDYFDEKDLEEFGWTPNEWKVVHPHGSLRIRFTSFSGYPRKVSIEQKDFIRDASGRYSISFLLCRAKIKTKEDFKQILNMFDL